MSFEIGVIILLFGVPALTALLIFGIPWILNKKQDGGNHPARV